MGDGLIGAELGAPLVRPRPVQVGGVELDFVGRAALAGGAEVHLSGSALSLLYLLAVNAERVLTRAQIQSALRAPTHVLAGNSVDRLVHLLRRALGDGRARPRLVETVVRGGYRFVPDDASRPIDGADPPSAPADHTAG